MAVAESLALGGLAALFLGLFWWTRRAPARRQPIPLSPELVARLQGRAREVFGALAEYAQARLEALGGELADPGARARLRGDAERLAAKLAALRASPSDDGQLHHEWDYLGSTAAERWPLLEPSIAACDLPALERVQAGGDTLLAELEPRLALWRASLDQAQAALAEDPSLVFGAVELAALTLSVADLEPAAEAAAALHLVRPSTATAARDTVRTGLLVALRLADSTPRAARVPYDGLPVPPLGDGAVAAAVVRQMLHRAASGDELARARALTFGEPELLFLALAVLDRHEYPAPAAAVHAELAASARTVLGGDAAPAEAAETARRLLGAEAGAAYLATLAELRRGHTVEALFGGAAPTSAASAGRRASEDDEGGPP